MVKFLNVANSYGIPVNSELYERLNLLKLCNSENDFGNLDILLCDKSKIDRFVKFPIS